jgi:UDP-N-acetylglucosamine--N-acetylmuramyl-(pentapeptide) pyrophosphoryl-undecaprenol N-acetylglucosamine transferase
MSAENMVFPFKIVAGVVQSFFLMRTLRPHVVVGTGGYVCGPPLFAASVMGIPTLIQEQNSYPGITTRLLARRATEVHLTFAKSKRYFTRQDNLKVSGNPTRRTVGTISREEGARHFGLDSERATLLVFGGSLGATSINNAMMQVAPMVAAGTQILWQTGERDYDRIRTGVTGPNIRVLKFIEQMEYAYAVCDLAICRAGATTVAELARAGVPAILVPYPYAAADHQAENARAMVEAGAAVVIADSDLQAQLQDMIGDLMHDSTRRSDMANRARTVGRQDAAEVIAQAVLHLGKA